MAEEICKPYFKDGFFPFNPQPFWWYWHVKNQRRNNFELLASGNRPLPFFKRTNPQIPIVLSPNQVPSQIEQIGNNSMCSQEPLRLA